MITDAIYRSYLRAKPYFAPDQPDSMRRSPDLLLPWLGKYPVKNNIVITGSKGKGSLARMIAALLWQMDRTGLFISPHILHFSERISIDGKPIGDDALEEYGNWVLQELLPVQAELSFRKG